MGSPGDFYRDVEENDDGYYQGHLPWAHSEGFSAPPETGMPKEFVPGRPSSDEPLACEGKYLEHDQEIVTAAIQARCFSCPAEAWCLNWAMANDESGIWAGLNTEDRAALKRQKERAAA